MRVLLIRWAKKISESNRRSPAGLSRPAACWQGGNLDACVSAACPPEAQDLGRGWDGRRGRFGWRRCHIRPLTLAHFRQGVLPWGCCCWRDSFPGEVAWGRCYSGSSIAGGVRSTRVASFWVSSAIPALSPCCLAVVSKDGLDRVLLQGV